MRISVAFCVLLLALLSGCSSIYMPNVPTTPMFTQQGEVYVGAHANIKGNVNGNAAVAVGRHIGLIANGSYIDNKQGNQHFKQYLYEGGIGYFTTFGKKKDRVLEFYGGYGQGNTIDRDMRASTTGMEAVEIREMDFDKIFVQANYATRKDQVKIFGKLRELSFGTAIRASWLRMSSFHIDAISQAHEENLFVEPVFFTRMALNNSFEIQYTNGFNIGVVDNQYLKPGNAVFTLGIVYKLSKKKKK